MAALVTPVTARSLPKASPQSVNFARRFAASTFVVLCLAWASSAHHRAKAQGRGLPHLPRRRDPDRRGERPQSACSSIRPSSSIPFTAHVHLRRLPHRRQEPGPRHPAEKDHLRQMPRRRTGRAMRTAFTPRSPARQNPAQPAKTATATCTRSSPATTPSRPSITPTFPPPAADATGKSS